MKKNFIYAAAVSVVMAMLSILAVAQDSRAVSAAGSLYVISANAGGVNYVEGKVAVAQKSGKSGNLLKGDNIEVGDKVTTGTNGKAEILLNPGSYIRLAENSGFEFNNTSLDDLQVKLTAGSAMFEVITDNDFKFVVQTPTNRFNIIQSGVYRVDVASDGSGKIEVWKGKAEVGTGNTTIIKGGRQATVNNGQVMVEKFKRDDKESLAAWSKNRAKELAKVNSRLERNSLRSTLLSSFNNNGWNLYNSYGLWVFDPFSRNHCFLPFGYGWSSPYGFDFGRDLWYFRLPQTIYNQPPPYYRSPPNMVNNDNGRTDNQQQRNRRTSPPFENIQKDLGRDHPVDRSSESDIAPSPRSNPSPRISPPVFSPGDDTRSSPPSISPGERKGKPSDN